MKMKKNLIDYELLWEKITDYAKATGRTTGHRTKRIKRYIE